MIRSLLALLLLCVVSAAGAETRTAIFAGGCFWCMQPPFDRTKGVVETVVGYSGGDEVNPTYDQVSNKRTGHREVVRVTYDPAQVSYAELLEVFWRSIDPTQANGQFADIGLPYQTAIFVANEEERRIAEESKQKLAASGKFQKPIAVPILAAKQFWPAEDYHQKYYLKNPTHYKAYYVGSGRGPFLEKTWGKKAE
jgi:peptide methionine sulfoxide reductase msrA/msrB